MARISRKNVQAGITTIVPEKVYYTGIYVRLSIEDNGIYGDSIENQIYLIEKYISEQTDLKYVDTFVDNGMTGVNFDRPAFQRLMEAVKKGSINCIVVKDLSRFGRNYLETGEYLEKIFPYLGIRFVSVNDNFDSFNENSNDSLIVSLKGILHDTYAKDISKKVSTAIDIKKKSGKFMGKNPPYGYIRSAENRHQLVIHKERGEVIKEIFSWRLGGMGVVSIAHKLNDLEIPSQRKIRWIEGYSDGRETALWHGSSVMDILRNPCYTGCMVERKSYHARYKGKSLQTVPRSQWKRIENMQEAIIDEDTFEKVQGRIEESVLEKQLHLKKYAYRQRTGNRLSGLLVCGVCGGKMQRDGGYYRADGTLVNHYFNCHRKYIKKGACTAVSVSEKELIYSVYEVCKRQISLLADIKDVMDEYINEREQIDKNSNLQKEMERLNTTFTILKNKRNDLYVDFKGGLVLENDYEFAKEQYDKDIESVKSKLLGYKMKVASLADEPVICSEWMGDILKFETEESLTREMCMCLIEKIIVRDNTFRIFFTFQSEYEQAILFMKDCVDGSDGL